MLELQKLVIRNISDDKRLFKKELIKSRKWLSEQDMEKLMKWVKDNYWQTHQGEIESALYFQYEHI